MSVEGRDFWEGGRGRMGAVSGTHNGPCACIKNKKKKWRRALCCCYIYFGADAGLVRRQNVWKVAEWWRYLCSGIGWIMKHTQKVRVHGLGFLCPSQNGTDGPFTSHQQFSGSRRVSKWFGECVIWERRVPPPFTTFAFFIASLSIMSTHPIRPYLSSVPVPIESSTCGNIPPTRILNGIQIEWRFVFPSAVFADVLGALADNKILELRSRLPHHNRNNLFVWPFLASLLLSSTLHANA